MSKDHDINENVHSTNWQIWVSSFQMTCCNIILFICLQVVSFLELPSAFRLLAYIFWLKGPHGLGQVKVFAPTRIPLSPPRNYGLKKVLEFFFLREVTIILLNNCKGRKKRAEVKRRNGGYILYIEFCTT
jgi:hypothetical protein